MKTRGKEKNNNNATDTMERAINKTGKKVMYNWKNKRFKLGQHSAIVFFVLLSNMLFGQDQANMWYFGTRAGLNFNTTPPTLITNGATNSGTTGAGAEGEGYASVADASGNPLFYTDGTTIWNRNHVVMTNGAGINGALTSAQSAIIVPRPGSTSIYYVFTVGPTGSTTGVQYNEVDMTLSAGLGAVTANKNVAVWTGVRTMEALCAVPHRNGTDYWVLCHGDGAPAGTAGQFRAFRVTSAGPQIASPVTSTVGYAPNNGQGVMKANSCYNKVAISYGGQPGGNAGGGNRIEILDFDNNTGVFTNPLTIDNFTTGGVFGPYGVEFSPNGTYLFMTELMRAQLYRYDISSGVIATIEASRTLMGAGPHGTNSDNGSVAFPRMAHVQLGPDGVIYVANHNAWHYWSGTWCSSCASSAILSTITSPNTGGTYTATAYTFPSAPDGGAAVSHGLPTLLKSYISGNVSVGNGGAEVGGNLVACSGQSIPFSYNTVSVIQTSTILWNFGDGNTSTAVSPTHTYAAPGTYTVTLTMQDICNIDLTDTRTIVVSQTSGALSCSGTSLVMTGTGTNPANYRWYDAATNGNLLGTGSSVSIDYSSNLAAAPTSVWVEDATNYSFYNLGATPASMTNITTGNTIATFDVLTPVTLQSIAVKPNTFSSPCGNRTFDIEIRNSSSALLFTRNYTLTGTTCGTAYTLTINYDLPVANGYTIRMVNMSGSTVSSGTWTDASSVPDVTQAGVAVNYGIGVGAGSSSIIGDMRFMQRRPCSQLVRIDRLCALPIVLIDFTGAYEDGFTTLNWATSEEKNNSHFLVQKSIDGINFITIGKIGGAGNSSSIQYYSYIDNGSLSATTYYRLVQYDFDGQNKNVGLVKVAPPSTELQLYAFPNPFSHATAMRVESADPTVFLKITDISGRMVWENKNFKTNQLLEVGEFLPAGVYLAQATSSGQHQTIKIIKE